MKPKKAPKFEVQDIIASTDGGKKAVLYICLSFFFFLKSIFQTRCTLLSDYCDASLGQIE